VLDPDDALVPVTLAHLRIEQPGQRHPAGFGLGPFVTAALGLNPATVVGHQRSKVVAKPIGAKSRDTVWRQPPDDLRPQALCHGQGALPDVHGQDQRAHGVHRHPHPVGGSC
jgi:hypothetical protein